MIVVAETRSTDAAVRAKLEQDVTQTVTDILGMPADEGRQRLDQLISHATQRQFVYSHRWRNGDLVVWDNRCVQHLAIWDYYPNVRSGFRVTVKGDRPV